MKKFLLSTILILGLTSCHMIHTNQNTEKEEESPDKEVAEIVDISFSCVGDNIIYRPMYNEALANGDNKTYDFTPMYEYVKPLVTKYDVAYVSQETILGGSELGLSTYPTFNSPQEVGLALIDTGFDLINQATNHSLDKGKKAITNTVDFWNQHDNVLMSGIYNTLEQSEKINILEVKGVKIAYLAYTEMTNGIPVYKDEPYRINLISEDKLRNDVQKAKEVADLVLVSLHFGSEYQNQPNDYQIKYANLCHELGVDFVMGSHPHVIQPLDILKDENTGFETLVAYSLGNFLSAQDRIDRLFGMMVNFEISYNKDTKEKQFKYIDVLPLITHFENKWNKYKVYPIYKYNEELAGIHYISGKKDRTKMNIDYVINKFDQLIDDRFNLILEQGNRYE